MAKIIYLESVRIDAANSSDILSLIDPGDLAIIKHTDPHPFFQMYSMAHEGESQPKMIGEKESPLISWGRKAIQSIKNVVVKGTNFFANHRKKGSTEKRKVIGKIIASAQKEINGRLHHVIVTYHKPEQKEEAMKCDSCSQEASWSFWEKPGRWIADKIESLKAVAGLNSNEDRPAFSGALRLAAIEAAHKYKEVTGEVNQPGEGEGNHKEKDAPGEGSGPGEGVGEIMPEKQLKDFTYAEIKKHMREERNAMPHHLFTEEDLKNDRQFSSLFIIAENQKTKIAELEKERDGLNGKLEDVAKKERAATARARAEEVIQKLKIDNEIIKGQLLKMAETDPERDTEGMTVEANRLLEIKKSILQQQKDNTEIPKGSGGKGDKKDFKTAADNPLIIEE